MKIGIIIAMDKEFRRISELLDGQKREEDGGRIFVMGRLGDNELVLHQCGIGKVNAAVGVSELSRPCGVNRLCRRRSHRHGGDGCCGEHRIGISRCILRRSHR